MLSAECLRELHTVWLPNLSASGLQRLIDLLEKGSPLLIHGSFSKAVPMGCLATHAAWHHPRTACLAQDAGVAWLTGVARLNPATSLVIREWDRRGAHDWELRMDLLEALRGERRRRAEPAPSQQPEAELVKV
jgi:hypothetical protein